MKNFKHLILSLFWLCSIQVMAANYYVSPTGNDSNSGTSLGSAFKTIQKAHDVSLPGDVINVADGNYNEEVKITRSGNSANWITYKSINTWGAKVYNSWGNACFNICDINGAKVQVSYIIIDGFDLTATGTYGSGVLSNYKSHHITVRNCWAHDCGESGLQLNDGDYRIAENNVCNNNGMLMPDAGSGISMYGVYPFDNEPGFHSIIRGNKCYGNINGPTTANTDGNGIIVDDHRMTQTYHKVTLGTNLTYNGWEVLVENNLCYYNGGAGIQVCWSNNITVRNNTCYLNQRRPTAETWRGNLSTSCCTNVKLINNISVVSSSTTFDGSWSYWSYNTAIGAFAGTGNSVGSNYTYYNNITYDINNPSSNSINTSGISVSIVGVNGNKCATNPLFVAPGTTGSADFHLLANSPALDAGTSAYGVPTLDLDGNVRVQGSAVDMGCYEFASGSTVPVTGVTVNPISASVNVGATQQLTAIVVPSNASNKTVSWSSSNTAVATVSASGLVTGVATGSATITVTTQDGNKTAACTITITTNPNSTDHVYNLSGINQANADYNAYACDVDVFPFGGIAGNRNSMVEAGDSEYTNISALNSSEWTTVDPSNGDEIFVWVEMKLNEAVSTITELDFTFNGYTQGSTSMHQIFVLKAGQDWSQSASWVQVGSSQSIPSFNTTMTRSITSNIADYIDGSGKIVWGIYETTSSQPEHINYLELLVKSNTTVVPVTGVTMSPSSSSLTVGATQQLTATVAPANATNKTVSWSSTNPAIATVNASGLVTAVAAGSATITVTTQDGNKTSTCTVTVNSSETDLIIEAESFCASSGVMVYGTLVGEWSVGDYTKYCSVNLVSGYSILTMRLATTQTGAFEIRLGSTSGTLIGTMNFNSTGSWDVYQDFSCNLTGGTGIQDVFVVGAGTANFDKMTFSGAGTTVAVTGVTVNPTSATIDIASTQQLAATISPANASNQNVSWNSSNTAVATVNSNGLVTAIAAGLATITVTTQDGSKTATCTINVNSPVINDLVIQAENFCGSSGISSWATGVGDLSNGNYVKYCSVNFSTGYNELMFYFATILSGSISIRIDGANGTEIGVFSYTSTGDWGAYSTGIANISSSITGVHDIYLVGGSGTMNLDYITLHDNPLKSLLLDQSPKIQPSFEVKVFPNPVTNGFIQLTTNGPAIEAYSLINLQGRLLKSVKCNAAAIVIDLPEYDKGVYFIQMVIDNNVSTQKFIIQ